MEPVILHGLSNCDACRTARRALEAAGRRVVMRDLRTDPPGAAEIGRWLDALGPGLLNRRSTTWRALPAAERDGAPAALMQAHPTLIRRPVIEVAGQVQPGWDPAVREALTAPS